MIHQQF